MFAISWEFQMIYIFLEIFCQHNNLSQRQYKEREGEHTQRPRGDQHFISPYCYRMSSECSYILIWLLLHARLDDERMDIVVSAKGDRGHFAKFELVLLCGDNVEKRGRNCTERFPHRNPQLNRHRSWQQENHTSNQLEMIMIDAPMFYSLQNLFLKNITSFNEII